MQRVNKIVIVLTICSLVFAGCRHAGPSHLSEQGYLEYVTGPKSGLNTVIESGIWKYKFQYRPGALISLIDKRLAPQDSQSNISRRYSSVVWFNVSMSTVAGSDDPLKYKAGSLNEYNRRLAYFLSAGPRFALTYGDKGEMKQVGYQFENNYNIKPEIVSVVGFAIPDSIPKERLQLVYTDELFNTGILKFEISGEDLNRIPKI